MMPPLVHLPHIRYNVRRTGDAMASKSYALKFVNLFARRQHRFHVAATPIDVDWNILSYPVPCLNYNFVQNIIIYGGSDWATAAVNFVEIS